MYQSYQLNRAWSTNEDFRSVERPRNRANLWERFKVWFMEPIDFPGKLPKEEDDSSEYNLIADENTQQTSDVNER
jgi:hypothetical protein